MYSKSHLPRATILFGLALLSVTAMASLLYIEAAGAAGTRLISHRQTLSEVVAVPGDGFNNAGPDGHSRRPSISADGRYIAFESDAGYFDEMEVGQVVPVDDEILTDRDIFLHDAQLGTTVRISAGPGGEKADGESFKANISPNGNWIVFESDATNLVPDDTNGVRDIFRYNRSTSQTTRISMRSSGDQATYAGSNASVADDGSVAFQTRDGQMTSVADGNNKTDVFVRSASGQVKLVSVKHDGSGAAGGTSSQARVSGDGSKVSFQSKAGAEDLTDQTDESFGPNLYVRAVGANPGTKLITADTNGDPAGWFLNAGHALSYDGRFSVFTSLANDLITGLSDQRTRLFVRDTIISGPAKIKLLAQDTNSNTTLFRYPHISPDGTWVAYQRDAEATAAQILLRPRTEAAVQAVSVSAGGQTVTDGSSRCPVVSNTAAVAFESDSLELKRNYLGRGLFTWNELWTEAEVGDLPCNPNECFGISLRETEPGSIEPGPSNPTPAENGGDPLVKVVTTSDKAGQATDMTVTLKRPYNYHEFEDVEFLMPVSLAANTNVEKCTENQANEPDSGDDPNLGCPDASRVGTVHTDVELIDNLQDISVVMGNKYKIENEQKDGMDGEVYFGEPHAGEAGRLYAVLFDPDVLKVPIVVPLSIAAVKGQNYRFKIKAEDIPNAIPDAHLKQYNLGDDSFKKNIEFGTVYPNIEKIEFTILGSGENTTNDYPFLRNPTFTNANPDITDTQKGIETTIDNYGGSRNERFVGYSVTGQEQLSFNPELEVELSPNTPNQVTDMKATLTRSVDDADLVDEADLRKVNFTMPKGIWVNGTAQVDECKPADADQWKCGQPGGSGQPIGTATAYSPLLRDEPSEPGANDGPLEGDAFLVESAEGKPMKLAVFLEGLIDVRLDGEIKMTGDKRIQAIFDAPPLPVKKFELEINDLLTTGGVACGSGNVELAGNATLSSWTPEIGAVQLAPKVTVNSSCTGVTQSSFAPKLSVASDNTTVGASPGNLALSVTRNSSDDPLTDFTLTLPQGMVGDLDATATKCSLAQAQGGGCPSSSKIGFVEATAQIFSGKTIKVEGGLFSAVPGSSEFGRFLATFDLPEIAGGDRLVLKSAVNPINNAQQITTSVSGAPPEFNITNVKMNLFGNTSSGANGPLLMNPTFASNGAFVMDAGSAHGLSAQDSAPYAVTGSLGFAPQLKASLSTKKLGAKPVISTEISQSVSETALKELHLSFKGFGIDITGALAGCPTLEKSLGACPPASKVATVKVHSWLLPTPLEGALYLGEGAKSAFMTLNGPITLNVEGDVSIDAVKGIVSVNMNKGLPPMSGSIISATVDGGLFKNPSKCGMAEISSTALSYAGQRFTDVEKFDYCIGATSTGSLKAGLKPRMARSYPNSWFKFAQPGSKKKAKKLKSLEIKLGKGKRAVRASTKTLKRKTRRSRRGRTLGKLNLYSAKKRRTVRAKIRVKRGRIYLSPSGKQVRRYKRTLKRLRRKKSSKAYKRTRKELKRLQRVRRHLKKKTKVRLSKGKLRLTRLPTSDGYYRVYVRLNAKRYRILRNPKRAGKVTFSAKAKTTKGKSITANAWVKIKKSRSKKKGSKKRRR